MSGESDDAVVTDGQLDLFLESMREDAMEVEESSDTQEPEDEDLEDYDELYEEARERVLHRLTLEEMRVMEQEELLRKLQKEE